MLAVKSSRFYTILLFFGFAAADVKTTFNETYEFGQTFQLTIHNSLMTVLSTRSCGKWNVSQITVDNRNKVAWCKMVFDRSSVYGLSVFPLTANEAILMCGIEHIGTEIYTLYKIINFTECKTRDILKIEYQDAYKAMNDFATNEDPIYINEDGTFEILTYNYKYYDDKICRYIFDTEGNKVRGPVELYKPMFLSHRSLYKIPSSLNFVIIEDNYHSGTYRTSLIADEVIVLKPPTYDYAQQHVISTSYGLIRLCSKTNNSNVIDCEVFDSNGKKMSSITVNVTENLERDKYIELQNLANGEFLLKIGDGYQRTGTIMKLKADGSVIGIAELSYFATEDDQPYPLDDIDLNDDQYCITRAAVHGYNLNILKQCYIALILISVDVLCNFYYFVKL